MDIMKIKIVENVLNVMVNIVINVQMGINVLNVKMVMFYKMVFVN